nr:BTAD domain-containing putative transcriptional regulator [Streptomyces scabichelini]
MSRAKPVRVSSFKQRALLAALACRAGSAVSVDRLVRTLWGDSPPRTANKNLQVYVWHLRKLLDEEEAPGRLQYAPPGYRLELRPGELDLHRFQHDVRKARADLARGEVEPAAGRFAAALDLWHGEALADLLAVPTLQAESVHLEEVRAGVMEDHFDAELSLRRYAEVVDAIGTAIRTHPFRERLRVQQIQALYLSGRQSEALAAYDAVRLLLAQELGLQPSSQLQQLQELILGGGPLEELPAPRATIVVNHTARPAVPATDADAADGHAAPLAAPQPEAADVEAHTGRTRPSRKSVTTQPSDRRGATVTRWTRRLPRTIGDFTGREDALGVALTAIRTGGASLMVVTGPLGAGKTAFAVHLSHQLDHDFPDGQLSVDLATPGGAPRPSSLVLTSLLRTLGADPDASVTDTGELAGLLRARLAPLRMLILLDDAQSEAQVRPLLPGTGSSVTVVTARSRLAGLEAARVIHVGRFGRADALRLLDRIIGADRVSAEREAAERIVDAVDRLPLAVRIAGARLAARPNLSLTRYAARLADPRRLARELTAGDLSFVDQLRRAYRQLSATEAEMLRLLCAASEPLTSERAGTLLSRPAGTAEGLLERLTDLHLAEVEYNEDRDSKVHGYRLPLLVTASLREWIKPSEFPKL